MAGEILFFKGTKSCVIFLAFCLVATCLLAEAEVHNLTWEVSYQYKSLDCYKKLAIAINGETPGPTINATEGDTIIVNVKNNLLMENLAIHWHGIRQIGTPWSDGTDGVSQCGTMPGDTFVYQFVVDKAGTYMYHSHYGMQRESGLYGLIEVSVPSGTKEPFTYDGEHGVVLSDWYHSSSYEQATGLTSIPYVWIGEPQSLLINGRGKYDCANLSASVCNAANPECAPSSFTVVPGETYRFRIASLTSLSALSFQIEGHNMTVVEADGNYVEPFATENLYIYAGETYSVLVTANQSSSRNYWITTNVVSRNASTPIGQAILNYYPNQNLIPPNTTPPPGPLWNDVDARKNQSLAIEARQGYIQIPPHPDKVIVLLNTQNKVDGYTKWAINNVSHTLPETPYLIALKKNWLDVFDQTPAPESYDYENYDIYSVQNNTNATTSSSIYRLEFNSTVDVILQNANTMTANNSETHPWHLHGHDFWVLGFGDGKYDMKNNDANYKFKNPIMKNTVPLHPYGWTALRFQANNPGIWLFHCHIEAHFLLGMLVLFESGSSMVSVPPQANMGCGKTKSLMQP
ncbi:hypothetical protein Patl1_27321 [Pistacia atlantica]|uniref:Uncharacterized protein n=1 Tax=Pistacia atlantica TaxID=434234 RepID=A0ACC1BE00_9ROSI|nr:hypothetical protein Patl1_27321 [Pistacia atlantica]